MKSNIIFIGLILFAALCIIGCKEEEDMRELVKKPIFPSDQPNALNEALVIFGEAFSGDLPMSTNANLVNITVSVPTAVVSNDNFLFLPFAFDTQEDIAGIYLQVEGANDYWDAPIELVNEEDNSFAIAIGIPAHIQEGIFSLSYKIYDSVANVSEQETISVSIAALENKCNNGGVITIEGQDGITVKTFDMGSEAGTLAIEYYMYTQKDRMDIRYNNQWVASTSPVLLMDGQAPPYKRCDLASPADGFVSGGGILTVDYDPAISREVSIYVSGCLQGGTLWYFNLDCLEELTPPGEAEICGQPSAQLTYEKTHENYHIYPTDPNDLKTVICDPETDPNCNLAAVFQAMLKQSNFIAPSFDTDPVEDCKITWVQILSPLNPIVSKVNYQSYSITNYTLANIEGLYGINYTHKLHPGKVTRSVKLENGKIIIQTQGEGTGSYASLNTSLDWAVWGVVDKLFKNFWEKQ